MLSVATNSFKKFENYEESSDAPADALCGDVFILIHPMHSETKDAALMTEQLQGEFSKRDIRTFQTPEVSKLVTPCAQIRRRSALTMLR